MFKKLLATVAAIALACGSAPAMAFTTVVDGIGLGSTTAPVLTACGTGSPTIVGTDMAGTVTTGTTATGCVITFNTPKTVAPACVVTSQVAPATSTPAYSVSTTAITWVQASQSGNKINYICMGL